MHYMLVEETQNVISKSDMPLENRSFWPKPSHHRANNTPSTLIPGGFSITSSLCTHCSESPTGRIFVSRLPWWDEQKWRPRQKSAWRLFWSPVRRGLCELLPSLVSSSPSPRWKGDNETGLVSRLTFCLVSLPRPPRDTSLVIEKWSRYQEGISFLLQSILQIARIYTCTSLVFTCWWTCLVIKTRSDH